MSQEGASGKCSVSLTGGRDIISIATPYPEETCPRFWLFPVLIASNSEEAKEEKGTETVAGERVTKE